MPMVNYEALQRQLRIATHHTLRHICDRARHEHLYAFGFYASDEMSGIRLTANTEEGLVERAQRYAQRGEESFEQLIHELRWISADWTYHCIGNEFFASVDELLLTGWRDDYSFYDGDPGTIRAICMSVLHTCQRILEEYGLRHTVLLNIFAGDTSIARLIEQARVLNPKDLALKYQYDLMGDSTH